MQSLPITSEVVSLIDTILFDRVCQWLATGQWFSPSTPVSSTINTDLHDIDVILFKVALNTTTQTLKYDTIISTMKYYKTKNKKQTINMFSAISSYIQWNYGDVRLVQDNHA